MKDIKDDELTVEKVLRRCNKLKERLDEQKAKKSELVGKRQLLMRQLKEQFGINDLSAAHAKIKAIDQKLWKRNKMVVSEYQVLLDKLKQFEEEEEE